MSEKNFTPIIDQDISSAKKSSRMLITGAAGLVGQNLIPLLVEQGYRNIIAIDKHKKNLEMLKLLNPTVKIVHADLAEPGEWGDLFKNAEKVILLHAEITSQYENDFIKNNIIATKNVLNVIEKYRVSYFIHVSSSVVNSVATDLYSKSKKLQEDLVLNFLNPSCVLRPTLLFGWFDKKHLGWLSRFMEKIPIFPIPGSGQYIRQPLYIRDFCQVIISAMKKNKTGVYNITGKEEISYINIICAIKKLKKSKTLILPIPYCLFYALLRCYSFFYKTPPFTVEQLKALTAGDFFTGVDINDEFDVKTTPLSIALYETFMHPNYSKIELERV